jgi:hypothetical protein
MLCGTALGYLNIMVARINQRLIVIAFANRNGGMHVSVVVVC